MTPDAGPEDDHHDPQYVLGAVLAQLEDLDLRAALKVLAEAATTVRNALPPPRPVNRILWNERGGDIDEIVIHDAGVHIEQMHDRCWWIGINVAGGGYWAGNFTCDSRGRMKFTEQEMDGFEWDDASAHREP